MAAYDLIATSTFGVEAVVGEELRALGYTDVKIQNGKVSFPGDAGDIAKCNLWLRTADRLLIKMADFRAEDFGQLFERTVDLGWENFIPVKGKMHVTGKSHQSKLFSVPDCQSIVKKAIVEAMKRKYPGTWFEETGPTYRIEIALLKDVATITMDTSGQGLHKRGYRTDKGEAPLRETLAAALVKLSRWEPGRDFTDPFCGSGTIPIEAALMARNMAPGLDRSFASEEWPHIPKVIWEEAREEARSRIKDTTFRILASDLDGTVLKAARENTRRARLSDYISFQKMSVAEFRSTRKYGCIVCNPPYGERTGGAREVEATYRTMGKIYSLLDNWSLFVLSPHPDFEKFFGRKADRKRKLYNGNILCHYYQYFGAFPPRRAEGTEQEAERETE
jgi:putative N6-adenine-specific DNA methylase